MAYVMFGITEDVEMFRHSSSRVEMCLRLDLARLKRRTSDETEAENSEKA